MFLVEKSVAGGRHFLSNTFTFAFINPLREAALHFGFLSRGTQLVNMNVFLLSPVSGKQKVDDLDIPLRRIGFLSSDAVLTTRGQGAKSLSNMRIQSTWHCGGSVFVIDEFFLAEIKLPRRFFPVGKSTQQETSGEGGPPHINTDRRLASTPSLN